MKIPMVKMSIEKQVRSKGMIAGWCLLVFGVYVFVETKDVNQAALPIGMGLGILGLRDDK